MKKIKDYCKRVSNFILKYDLLITFILGVILFPLALTLFAAAFYGICVFHELGLGDFILDMESNFYNSMFVGLFGFGIISCIMSVCLYLADFSRSIVGLGKVIIKGLKENSKERKER